MSLTKRNKTLLSVFCVGLIALAADRTILRPQGGSAAASASQSHDSEQPSGNAPAPSDGTSDVDVADRLVALWSGQEPDFEQVRNPFALPAAWFGTPDAAEDPACEMAIRFIRTHRLTAIGRNGGESYVMVGDRVLATGQLLDGFTLVSIGDRSTVFEREGQRVALELTGKE
jgi:hypothetical protein